MGTGIGIGIDGVRPGRRAAGTARVAAVLAAALAGAGAMGPSGAPTAPPAANLLLVTVDTLRTDRVGAYGGRRGLTPVMDALARDGVVFEQATVPVPLTRPSHVSLLTGKLPFQHGIRDNFSPALGSAHRSLAEVLSSRGYATGGFVGAFMLNEQSGLNRGFDRFDAEFDGAAGKSAFLAEHQRRAGEVEQRAGAWIERAAAGPKPFFAWVHFYDPHSPYDPPPPYRERYAGRPYDGEVAYTDAVLGKLLARLAPRPGASRGGARPTLVVVTSDHGEGLGDHGEAEHGFFLYETTVRVPLIVRLPVRAAAGTRVATEARSIDVLPTILDLLGVAAAAPPGLPGRSLAEAIRGGAAGPAPPSYAETLFPRLHFDCADLRSVRVGGWKYIDAPRPELYDLRADPGERANLFAREGTRARAMRSRLLDVLGGSPESAVIGQAGPPIGAEAARRLASLGYVSGSGGSGGTADPKDEIAAYQEHTRSVRGAFEAYGRGDLQAAAAGFESAIASGRAAFDVYYYLGAACVRLGQAERALGPLTEALRRNPGYTPSAIELSTAYLALKRPDEAWSVLREAVAGDPGSFQLHSHLGYVARLRRDLATARAEYENARSLNPNDFEVRMNLSAVYRDAGDAARALAEADAALALRPDSAEAYNQRGMLLGGEGRFAEASTAFERATAGAPRNPQFWFNLGLSRLRASDKAGAADALRRALALKPDFADARALLAEAERK